MVDRIALLFNIGRQWLTTPPRYPGAMICGASAVGAMIVIGYNANKGISPRSEPVVPTSDVVPAQDSAKSNELLATKNPDWSRRDTAVEPFWPSSLARRVSFAETEAPSDPGTIGAKDRLTENSIWDAEVVKPFSVNSDFRSGKEGPLPTVVALDKSFLVNESENENVATRDKDEVKKTAKSSEKKPQRRVKSRERDRGFSPLREIRRAPENIRKVIRRIF